MRFDASYFKHDCLREDITRHLRCPGGWLSEITTGRIPQGRRMRRRVSGPTQAAIRDALKNFRAEIGGRGYSSPNS